MSIAIDFLSTDYRPDLNIWVCRWNQLESVKHLPACYEYIFNQAITNDWNYWLIDIRGRGKADKTQQDWYFNDFLPEKVKQLTGHNYLAYLVTPSYYSYIKEMQQFHEFENLNKKATLTTHFYQSEQEAIDWLLKMQPKSF